MTAAHDTQALAERAFLALIEEMPGELSVKQMPALTRFLALASRLQEQEGQPALSERPLGWAVCGRDGKPLWYATGCILWPSKEAADGAAKLNLSADKSVPVYTLAAGSQAVQVPEATQDELLELAEALERRRCITISETVKTEQTRFEKDGKPTAFSAGFTLACEEIAHRIEHEEWVFQDPGTPLQPLAGGEVG